MSQRHGYSKTYSTNFQDIDWSNFRPALTAKAPSTAGSGPHFMPDITSFVSPIDYTLITSRSQLRDHEKRHGVKQVGSDLKASDYTANKPAQLNERALEGAYRTALAKRGML
jgi:hypothetical protein